MLRRIVVMACLVAAGACFCSGCTTTDGLSSMNRMSFLPDFSGVPDQTEPPLE